MVHQFIQLKSLLIFLHHDINYLSNNHYKLHFHFNQSIHHNLLQLLVHNLNLYKYIHLHIIMPNLINQSYYLIQVDLIMVSIIIIMVMMEVLMVMDFNIFKLNLLFYQLHLKIFFLNLHPFKKVIKVYIIKVIVIIQVVYIMVLIILVMALVMEVKQLYFTQELKLIIIEQVNFEAFIKFCILEVGHIKVIRFKGAINIKEEFINIKEAQVYFIQLVVNFSFMVIAK